MDCFFKVKISRFCVANLESSKLFPSIYALNRNILPHEKPNPDLIRGSLGSLLPFLRLFAVSMSSCGSASAWNLKRLRIDIYE
jgi:hypothetical protein